MAPFRNQSGEVSPDQMRVQVFVNQRGSGATLDSVVAENSNQVMEKVTAVGLINSAVTLGAQGKNFISPAIDKQALDLGTAISVTRIPQKIVLLDTGRWGGPKTAGARQRNIGIVSGTWAALFDFEAHDAALDTDQHLICEPAGTPVPDNPINDLIREFRKGGQASLRLLRSMRSDNPNYLKGWTQDTSTVFVILPDLHLPICTAMPDPVKGDGHHMGRVDYTNFLTDDNGIFNGKLSGLANTWFKRYLAGDIFGGPTEDAAKDLNRFLDLFEGATLKSGLAVHFVQIGDMYDLWIGLERFFTEQATQTVLLRNQHGMLAGIFIDNWADKTAEAFRAAGLVNIVERLNKLAVNPKFKTSWLWGNHDNYLSIHTPVMPAGKVGVPVRQRKVEGGGILIEHGQRGDPENRDGAVSGHDSTNDVFKHPLIRQFDPNRRNFYTALAAVTYVASPSFHIFVMGHTHSPFMTRVQVETVLMAP